MWHEYHIQLLFFYCCCSKPDIDLPQICTEFSQWNPENVQMCIFGDNILFTEMHSRNESHQKVQQCKDQQANKGTNKQIETNPNNPKEDVLKKFSQCRSIPTSHVLVHKSLLRRIVEIMDST